MIRKVFQGPLDLALTLGSFNRHNLHRTILDLGVFISYQPKIPTNFVVLCTSNLALMCLLELDSQGRDFIFVAKFVGVTLDPTCDPS